MIGHFKNIRQDKNHNKIVVDRIKKNDLEALIQWVDERKENFYKIGWSYLKNQYDIEDAVQITILKIYDNIFKLKNTDAFESWVTTIYINECKRMCRDKKRIVTLENIQASKEMEKVYSNIELDELLDKLDELHKEVIVLKYMHGYSQEEISELLNIPIGTVKSRIHRAVKILKNVIIKEV